MVFLTFIRYARNRGPDPFWKREQIRRLAGKFYGRQRNCVDLSQNAWKRALRFSVWGRAAKKDHMSDLWESRIDAAAQEHGLYYYIFREGLARCNISLNRKVLADLAIYEPRTFKSLAMLSKHRLSEEGYFNNTIEPVDGVVTRGLLDSPICEGNRHLYPSYKQTES